MVKPYYIYGCSVYYIYGQILLHLWLVVLLHLWLKVITFMVGITFMGDTVVVVLGGDRVEKLYSAIVKAIEELRSRPGGGKVKWTVRTILWKHRD